jgi:Tol biopolymer transport system component
MRAFRRPCVVAAILTLATTVAGAPLAHATVPGANGRIAFARFDPALGDGVTYVANSDGSNLQPLLAGFTSGNPHWSPDGSQVAVISGLGAPCPPTCTGNTVIITPTTGDTRVLASPAFPALSTFCSIWSPDASHFLCDGENDDNAAVNGIYTIRSSDGGGLTRITDAGGMVDVPIDYSPDGRQIVFGRTVFHDCSNRSALYVVNVDGTGLHRITPWGFCDDDGSWSPDGSLIAFAKPGGSIFTVHPDGTGLAKLPLATNSYSAAGDVSWSPDGRRIVMLLFTPTGPHSTEEGIATANVDGTDVRLMTVSPTMDSSPSWGAMAAP